MLRLLVGTDWVTIREHILSDIARAVENNLPGQILIVPELISHDTERRLCMAAGDRASRFAEVVTFTRLARRVSDHTGNAMEECLDAGGRMVAMAAAARGLPGLARLASSRCHGYHLPCRPPFVSWPTKNSAP